MSSMIVLGGSDEADCVVEAVLTRGLTPIVACPSRDEPAARGRPWVQCDVYGEAARAWCVLPIVEAIAAGDRGIRQDTVISGVICGCVDAPLLAAHLAAYYRVPGLDVETAGMMQDKALQVGRLKRLAPPVVDCGPAVSRPRRGRGSIGVEYIPAGEIVQRRIYGQQVSTEGLVIDGVYHHVADADRHYDVLDLVPVEYGGSLPADLTGDQHEGMLDTLSETARRLGLRDCVLKGDLCLDDNGEWWVFEAAARLSGGYFSTFQIPYSTGYDLVGAAVDLALGDVPRLPSGEHHRPIAKRSAWGPCGIIRRIGVSRPPGLLRVVEHIHPGQDSPGPGTNRGAAVTVFAVSPEAALEAARSVVVEVV